MYHNLIFHIVLLVVAIILFLLAFAPVTTSRNLIALGLAFFAAAFLCSCANTTLPKPDLSHVPIVIQNSPAGQIGSDLTTAATMAMADFATVKAGNANYLWSLGQAFSAYTTISKTTGDVKSLVAAWTADTKTPIAGKIANLFGASSGSTVDKMKALADAAFAAAGAQSTSTNP